MVPSFTEKANKFVRPTRAMGREGSQGMNRASQLRAARVPDGAARMGVGRQFMEVHLKSNSFSGMAFGLQHKCRPIAAPRG
jgi:hypothetical protein